MSVGPVVGIILLVLALIGLFAICNGRDGNTRIDGLRATVSQPVA